MEATAKPRFHDSTLSDNQDAKVLHVEVGENARDRFGNRLFTSSNLSYSDREGNAVKAGILISKEGEEFIKSNPGIMNDIDTGLRHFSSVGYAPTSGIFTVGEGRTMRYLSSGWQSSVCLLEVNGEKYVVKTGRNQKQTENSSQPYINEMLQVQALDLDLGSKLAEIGVRMPKFMFASGQVSCAKFEEGVTPKGDEIAALAPTLATLVRNYIREEKKKTELWKNITPDTIEGLMSRPFSYLKAKNFIKKPDGTKVWIDPLYYNAYRGFSGFVRVVFDILRKR